jgi:hypothetical protein
LDPPKWDKLCQINTEISIFKSKGINSEYGLRLDENIEQKLLDYEPLPFYRKKRTRLNKVKKSNTLQVLRNQMIMSMLI